MNPGCSFPAAGQENIFSLATPDRLHDVIRPSLGSLATLFKFVDDAGATGATAVGVSAVDRLLRMVAAAFAAARLVTSFPSPSSRVCHHDLVLRCGRGRTFVRAVAVVIRWYILREDEEVCTMRVCGGLI